MHRNTERFQFVPTIAVPCLIGTLAVVGATCKAACPASDETHRICLSEKSHDRFPRWMYVVTHFQNAVLLPIPDIGCRTGQFLLDAL